MDDHDFEPEPTQVVSDLGQLLAFHDPIKIQLLRVLQREEASCEALSTALGEPVDTISGHIRTLLALGLLRQVGHAGEQADVYRARARIFDLQPEPRDAARVMAPVASATLDSVRQDVVNSLRAWPNQMMNYESRQLRMSQARAMEFNDRLIQLLGEFWGNPDQPVDEEAGAPVMAFGGIWYRFPNAASE